MSSLGNLYSGVLVSFFRTLLDAEGRCDLGDYHSIRKVTIRAFIQVTTLTRYQGVIYENVEY